MLNTNGQQLRLVSKIRKDSWRVIIDGWWMIVDSWVKHWRWADESSGQEKEHRKMIRSKKSETKLSVFKYKNIKSVD